MLDIAAALTNACAVKLKVCRGKRVGELGEGSLIWELSRGGETRLLLQNF